MMVSQYKVERLLARRRQLEYELFKVNQEMEDPEHNPYTTNWRRDLGFPFNLMDRSFRWIFSVGVEQPMERLVEKALQRMQKWFDTRKTSKL